MKPRDPGDRLAPILSRALEADGKDHAAMVARGEVPLGRQMARARAERLAKEDEEGLGRAQALLQTPTDPTKRPS